MIEVRDLVKRYGRHLAVDHLSFTVPDGQIFGFLGPNGAGKSTTMNLMTGYLGPTEGEILVDGHSVTREPEKAKQAIGYLPEQPPLYLDMTAEEYLEFAARLKKVPKGDRGEQTARVMELTGITGVRGRLLRNLSKGYRQRVGLAQALLGFPKVLILDEPTAGLDPRGRDEILDQIASLHRVRGITILLVSHSMEDIARYVERIIVMNHGEKAFDGPPKQVFAHYKELETMGLAAPQITYIVHDLKEAGLLVDTEATTVGEARDTILSALGERGELC